MRVATVNRSFTLASSDCKRCASRASRAASSTGALAGAASGVAARSADGDNSSGSSFSRDCPALRPASSFSPAAEDGGVGAAATSGRAALAARAVTGTLAGRADLALRATDRVRALAGCDTAFLPIPIALEAPEVPALEGSAPGAVAAVNRGTGGMRVAVLAGWSLAMSASST